MRNQKRMDGVTEVVTKEVEVSRLVEPQFLTLTSRPANQVAFKIVRDDNQKEDVMTQDVGSETRRRRIRSTKRSSLLTIEFPEGTTEAEIELAVTEYGLDGYEMIQDADTKRLCLRRSDLSATPENTVSIKIGNGRVANIARADSPPATEVLSALSVVAIEFKKENFADEAAVMAVISRYDIDFLEKGIENTDSCIRVVRSEVVETDEVRRVEVEPGVVAVVMRADTPDMGTTSQTFIGVVCEECYGQWGWGQLDFGAMMADIEFCEAAEEATYRLRNLVDRILFYSELPVAIRKDLIARASTQFAAYLGSLLDALPTKVVMINRSNLEKSKESSMTKQTEQSGAADATTPVAEQPITRAELVSMITAGVAAAMAAATPPVVPADESVQRSEAAPPADSSEGKVLEAVETVTRSISDVAKSLENVAERLAKMEGSTVARSDGSDDAVVAPQKDVFAGCFGGLSK